MKTGFKIGQICFEIYHNTLRSLGLTSQDISQEQVVLHLLPSQASTSKRPRYFLIIDFSNY